MDRPTPPAGFVRAGLWGLRQSPSIGLPLTHGVHLTEDWLRYGGSGDYGDIGSTLTHVGGGGAALVLSVPTAATELGIAQLQTGTTANRGGQLAMASVNMIYQPGIGMVWATKIDIPTVTNVEVWSGLANSSASRVRTTDNVEFIGARYIAGTDTWEGVTKTGSGGSNETVTVLTGAHVPGTYVRLGWEAVDTDGAGTMGIQWLTWDTSDRRHSYPTKVGAPVTTTIPTTIGPCLLGVVTTAQSQRIALQDSWELGGRCAR
jgi:hypothetical protein